MQYYTHSLLGKKKEEWQGLIEHLEAVARMSTDFASWLGASEWGYAAGILHDLGKYATAFQRRLEGGQKVDHSTAGAREAVELYGKSYGKIIAYAVAGHHGRISDYSYWNCGYRKRNCRTIKHIN